MSDYLGPLTLGSSGTYTLESWEYAAGTASLKVIVTAASTSALTAAVEALAAQLKPGNAYVHTFPLSATPVLYRIASASEMGVDEATGPLAFWARCSFSLTLSALPAGALHTLYSAEHVAAPASLSLAGLLGTNPPTLDVTVDDDSGNDMHSVICALAPTALSDSMWLVKASALTWTTMSSGTDSSAWLDNTVRTTTSANWQSASIDAAKYPAGWYRLAVRSWQSSGTAYVEDSQNLDAVAVARSTPHIQVIGDVELPPVDSAAGVAAPLTIYVKSDGTNTFTLDAVLLIPLFLGAFWWHHSVPTGECDQVDVGPSGVFVDGTADTTYLKGGILVPKMLAAQVGTLVGTASPSGSSWPTDWDRTDGTDVTAASSKFHFATTTAQKEAWYAATNAATPLVVPGAWYELSCTRQVTARSAGSCVGYLVWQDVDGNTVRTDTAWSVATTDASPVSVTFYAKAPVHAARCQVRFGSGAGATITADVSAVVLRRCPLRLIVVAEDSAGAVSSYAHAVHVSVSYVPRYEVAR